MHYLYLLLLWPLLSLAQTPTPTTSSVGLAWDRSPESAVTGYRVYWGTSSRAYGNVQDAGNALTSRIYGLEVGKTYYFAATAYEGNGLESDFSEEVSYTVPPPKVDEKTPSTKRYDRHRIIVEGEPPLRQSLDFCGR